MTTIYSPELLRLIAEVKGDYADDEIRRDLDPSYVELSLRHALFAFLEASDFTGRILDFGCGAGASTMALTRLLPDAEVVGVDLDGELLRIAEARRDFYGANVLFLESPSPDELPEGIGTFDFIVLSAVWEHLLPAERPQLLASLLGILNRGGLLFINQTPHRWFPVEFHTTGLPLVNYLPARLARVAADRSKRPGIPGETWDELLRNGIRGGSHRELRRLLRGRGELVPPRQGSYQRLWLEMSQDRGRSWKKQMLYPVLRLLGAYPSMTVAVRKR